MTTVTPDATVTLPAGTVSGTTLKSGVRQYLGVPYAEPPIDSREAAFEAPRPLTPWPNVDGSVVLPTASPYFEATSYMDFLKIVNTT